MQISAANLLVASQQPAKTPQSGTSGAAFSSSLSQDTGGFSPLTFKSAAAPAQTSASSASTGYGGTAAIGATLDITV
jgi:hypothetical protein